MGRCHEFGLQIHDGCGHPMVAGEEACACSECGVVCGGRFAGCPDVWARGPQPVAFVPETAVDDPMAVPAPADGNGQRHSRVPVVAPAAAAAESVTEPQSAPADASVAALRWLDAAFAGLRDELHMVRSSLEHQHAFLAELTGGMAKQQAVLEELTGGMAKQQAMLDELIAARGDNTRLKTVAQALPGLVSVAVTRAVEASGNRTAPDVEDAIGRAVDASESRAVAVIETAVGRAVEQSEARTATALDDAVGRAVMSGEARTMAALEAAFTRAVEQSEARAAAAFDGAIQRAVEGTEAEALVALEEAVGRAVEATLARHAAREDDHEAVAVGARTLIESDPETPSAIAAIATQAASQSVRTEIADQLPETVEKVLAGSDARLEQLVERMENVVARATRLATPPPTPPAPSPPGPPEERPARATKKAAAPAKAATRKTVKAASRPAAKARAAGSKATKSARSAAKASAARQPRKATRTSSQATRPSRRSLGA